MQENKDHQQDIEIVKMQEVNKRQDTILRIGIFALSIMIFIFIILVAILSSREISCPHKDCPHYFLKHEGSK